MFNEPLVEATLDMAMASSGRSGKQVLDLYRRNRPGAEPYELAAAVETDRMFRPAIRLADAQSAHNSNTHMYRFDWRSTAMDSAFGACHFLEVPFVFDRLDNDQARGIAGELPQMLADDVHAAWVAFVKTGDPQHAGLPTWPSWDATTRPTMCFGLTSSVENDPEADERAVWDGVIA